MLLFRPSPVPLHAWRRALLRLFRAKIGKGVHVYPSARVWAPWNLHMEDYSCLGPRVDCYTPAPVHVMAHATISQDVCMCSATHDYTHPRMPLVTSPIVVGAYAWIAAGAFVAPGVTIGEGAVVGARAVVVRDVPAWVVAVGNPARVVKVRKLKGGVS